MDTRDAITIEQARFLHRNTPPAVLGAALVVLILVVVFWRVVEERYLVAWGAAVALLTAGRMWVWHAYRVRESTLPAARSAIRATTAGAFVSGCLWGVGALFMLPAGHLDYQLMYLFALSMMAVGAMFSYSVHYATYMAFFIPATFPAMIGMLVHGALAHAGLAGGLAIFIVIVFRFVRTYNTMFVDAQKLRFENVDLVAQLTEQIAAARSANLAKSRFLAAASHDLRQPMHALNLYLGGLAGLDLSAPAKATLGNASQCAQTMDGMFRALLDISRLDAGAVQPETRAFPVAPLLDRIRLEHEPQARAKGLELRVAPCSAWVSADPAFVDRILRNLTANAVRHTERGKVLIGCRKKSGMLQIAVLDTGPGIAPEQQRLVFEEFYQVGNPERDRSKGIGLGLAIVDRLAKLMQAQVGLASAPGRGSAFTLELPLAARGDAQVAAAVAQAGAARGSFAGTLVAVIDDEEMILNATRNLLEQWQCKVVTAPSGESVMQQLSTSPRAPDAIVCDYRLKGGENGLAVIDALRAEFNEDIPALLITGDTGPERLREIQASGLSVLHKPVQDQVLRDALGGLLRNSGTEPYLVRAPSPNS